MSVNLSSCGMPSQQDQCKIIKIKKSLGLKRKSEIDHSESQSSVVDLAFKTYKESCFYHGTSAKSAKLIRTYGMDVRKKTDGSTSALQRKYGLSDPAACKYNYMMTLPEAAEYARMHDQPEIVQMIVPLNKFKLEQDPEGDSKTAFRTSQKIDSYFILHSKENLRVCQLEKINKELNLPVMSYEQLFQLKDRICKELMEDTAPYLENASSFIQQEANRDILTKDVLKSSGIDLSKLKPGEAITVDIDMLKKLLKASVAY